MSSKNIKRLSLFVIFIVIVILSLLDLKQITKGIHPQQDKFIHTLQFMFLVLISKSLFRNLAWKLILPTLFLFGLLIEIMQELFSNGNRHFHFSDILANMLGIGLGVLLVFIFYKKPKETLS